MWTCRYPHVQQQQQQQNSTTKTQTTIILTLKRIWVVRKAHLAAVDASIGQHGKIVICSVSGHVFIGRPEANGYKFNQISSIQRCIQVCANSSGAFAAIRSEYELQPITDTPASTLVNDMISSLPHVEASNWLKKKLETIASIEMFDTAKVLNKYTKPHNSQIDEEDVKDYESEKNVVKEKYDDIRVNCVHDAWKRSDLLAQNDLTLDIIFIVDGRNIYCHNSRSEIFKRLVKCNDHLVGGDIKIKLNKRTSDGKIEIYIEQCQLASILLLLNYIYTDEYQHPMGFNFELPVLSSMQNLAFTSTKSIQEDPLTLALVFHIPHLITSAQKTYYHRSFSLKKDLTQLLENEKGTNVVIKTKDDDQDTTCHEIILRQQCAFFENILNADSIWVENRRRHAALKSDDRCIQVNLNHISKEVMDTIIRYIHADEDRSSLFCEIGKSREESMMYFLLSLLSEVNTLLLGRLLFDS